MSCTEYGYDNPSSTGNLTEQRSWDSTEDDELAAPDANGSRLRDGNFISITNTYDPAHRNVLVSAKDARLQPARIRLGNADAPASRLSIGYEYGVAENGTLNGAKNNGNVYSQTIKVPAAGTTPEQTIRQSYEYDALNRLESAVETSGAAEAWKQVYEYDRFGNRELSGATTMPAVAALSAEAKKIYDPEISPVSNRIEAGQGYVYDAAGNVKEGHTSAGWFTFTYDAEGRTTSADGVGEYDLSRYSYDGDGRRVRKETGLGGPAAGGGVTVFVYDAFGKLVAEYANTAQQQPGGT